ncbi:unnamed protein product [Bursaphelenchus okinawaensis]|uniref:3'-5' exonuclease domain-containing protein n=1 Tax=Bursaphelenchus okinawaensis TaxID=465554 RepID=A0A811KHE7_9BILA|nr:unnamed protein product [Bursaphelenchus okinawaensis]CAG9103188.1 unnamed protein product [Bursaphelenchus okinawaensis]
MKVQLTYVESVANSVASSISEYDSYTLLESVESFCVALNELFKGTKNYLELKNVVVEKFGEALKQCVAEELYEVYLQILLSVEELVKAGEAGTQYVGIVKRILIKEFAKFVMEKRSNPEGIEFMNIAASGLHAIPHIFGPAIYVYYKQKCIEEFKNSLLTKATRGDLVHVLTKKAKRYVGEVLKWILALPIKKMFDYTTLTAYAVLNNDLSDLYALCRIDEEIRTIVVSYLDYVCGDCFVGIDPVMNSEEVFENSMNHQLKQKLSTVVKVAFNIFKEFNMDKEMVANCIYYRQMNDFIYVLSRYKKGELTSIEQPIVKTMEKGFRLQFSVLNLIASNLGVQEAVFYAMLMDIPEGKWPGKLQDGVEDCREVVMAKLAAKKESLEKEQRQIDNGIMINSRQDHRLFVVDSIIKIHTILKPFMDSNDKFIGMDAEWDASDCGLQGELCIVQLSSRKQTVVIDVTTLKTILNDEQWVDLWSMVFGGETKLIGFALLSDIQVLVHNFSFLEDRVPKMKENMICLHNAFNVILGNAEMTRLVFGYNIPSQNNLFNMTKYIMKYELSKQEQSSVWSARPLRMAQLRYAAEDSMSVYGIYCIVAPKIYERFPEEIENVFQSMAVINKSAKGTGFENLDIAQKSVVKKTKASHLSKKDLEDIATRVNDYFVEKKMSPMVNHPEYLHDTMCTQLAICLRRIGISVTKLPKAEDLQKWIENNSNNFTVMTVGKAAKNFTQFAKVIDTASSSEPLDVQIELFLKRECLSVNVDNYKSRCEHCNKSTFCMVPKPYMQYLHLNSMLQNDIKRGQIDVNEDEVEESYQKMKNYVYPIMEYACTTLVRNGETLIFAQNAIINPIDLTISQLINRNDQPHRVKPKKLTLATHKLLKESTDPHYMLYGICTCCGRENTDIIKNPLEN